MLGVEQIRRVVAGENESGESVLSHVDVVESIENGALKWYGVWGWDTPPQLPWVSSGPFEPRSAFPDPDGSGMRVSIVTMPPGHGVRDAAGDAPRHQDLPPSPEYAQLSAAQPFGLVYDHATGMHSTDSIDIGFILDGELELEQGNGTTETLRRGDVYIQHGSSHAWRNRSDAPATIAYVLLSAKRL